MNLLDKCTEKEVNLLKEAAGNIIENKDYTKEELERLKVKVGDYIMSHSFKDINKVERQFQNIFKIIDG